MTWIHCDTRSYARCTATRNRCMLEWFSELGLLGRLGVAGLFLAAAGIAWVSGW